MSIFDKYNQQRKDGTYQAPKENVTRQSFEATIQRDAPELYNAVQQQRAINMWNSYVEEQQRRYEEAVKEATHGRGNRSYLREEMLSGSYRNQQAMEAEEKRESAGVSYGSTLKTNTDLPYAAASLTDDGKKRNQATASAPQPTNKGTTTWAGRDALVKEYQELQNRIDAEERRLERGGPGDAAQLQLNKQRLEEIRQELEAKDAEAGIAPQAKSTWIDKFIGVDSSKITGEKTDWWRLLQGAWYKGADQFSTGVAGGLNWLFGDTAEQIHSLGVQTINDIIGGINSLTGTDIKQVENNGNILTNWYEELKAEKAYNEQVFAANANSSRAAQIIDKFGTEFVAAVPMALEAMMLTPYYEAKAAATATTAGLEYISGLQAAKGMEAAGMMARQSAQNLIQNPQFWSSYVQAIGDSAETAEESGMSPEDAAIYTLINGFINATIEVGGADETLGGIQNLPMRLRQLEEESGKKAVVEWFKASVLGEGLEEVEQGIFERGLKAPATGAPIASLNPDNQTAVFNPWTSAQEFAGGAVVGGLLGGAQTTIVSGAGKVSELRDIDEQRAEQKAMRKAGYGSVSNQVDAAWDVLTGRVTPEQQQSRTVQAQETIGLTPEQALTVEQYQNAPQEVRQQAAASANTAALLTSTFTASGIELNETEQETLTRLAQEGEAGTKDTVLGMRDAYRLGKQGKTLEETTLAVEERGLTPMQISRAWGFGASVQTAESGTADMSTEEGRTKVEAALSFFGRHVDAAAKLYEERQDVGRYAAAMQKAAFLYAANGADLTQIVQDARDGKTADIVGYLTDEQVKLAQEIGQEQRQQVREAEKAVSDNMEAIRQQAAAITAGQTVTAQALAETDTAIDVANRASQRAVNAINRTVERLEAMVKANPNAENTEAYKQAYDEAMQQKKKIEGLQRTVRELTRKKAELEGRKTIKRKKGTISYAGGTVEGKRYDGVDPAKLTRQQKKVTAMVETLADAVNLDYVFISADPGMGGAYVKGGTVYVNINAGMGVGGFSQTMAAASLSHELTHWMQDYAPEQYRELKDFIISEILKADPQKLRQLVEQQRRWEQGRSLSYEQALDEVVANACQTMLLDSKAITKLARQNMSLAARIADFIEDWTNKIKEAFAEVDTTQGAIYDAVRAVEDSLEHIQELWDNGIEAAAANYNAEKTVQEASAEESSEVRSNNTTTENAAQNIGDVKNQKFSYEYFNSKPDMHLSVIENHAKGKNRADILDNAKKNAVRFGGINKDGNAFVNVKDLGEAVQISPTKLKHGLDRRVSVNGPVTENVGEILSNSILINELNPRNIDSTTNTYALIGAAKNAANELYIVEFVVNRMTNELEDFNVLYSLNAKKEPGALLPSARLSPTPITGSTISISNLLEYVNQYFPDILPEDVLQHFGHERRPEGKLGASALYQQWSDEEYDAAVKSKDTEKAQQIVNAAAERAMPDSKIRTPDGKLRVVYHGTNSSGFTVFDSGYIGTASGDTGFFGRGFYFAYDSREARYYGKNVMNAFLNITNPFNFQTELNMLDRERTTDYNGGRAAFLINFAEKFPELVKGKTISVYDTEKGSIELPYTEFSKIFRDTMKNTKFEIEERDGEYGKEWLVKAGKHTESFTNRDGETYSWDEYDYQQTFTDERMAKDKVANAYEYLKSTKWSYINLPAQAEVIMDTDFSNELQKRGYDGVIQSEEGDEVVAFRPEQIKSADPVTYDDAGKVIPLAERFQTENQDIRYQRWDDTDGDTAAEANGREQAYAQIESENAVLKETVAALRKLTDKQSGTIAKLQKRLQITKTQEVRESDAKRMAGQLVREYGSRADREKIAGELKALGDYILQTEAAQLNEDEIKSRARQIAVEILDDAREQYAIEDENLSGIAKSIKGKKLTIDPAFLGELDQAGGFDAVRKRNFYLFTLAKADSQSIDRSEYTSVSQFYSDLQSEYGKGYFPDLANEGEELLAIAENARAAAPMEINPFEQYMGEAVEHLSNQIAMDALGGVLRPNPATDADRAKTRREALNDQIKQLKREQKIAEKDANELWQTVYDLSIQLDRAESKYKSLGEASKSRIAQVKAEGSARQAEIKAREREKAAKNIKELKEHYKEMRKNARERRENTGTRRKIRKLIDQLNNRLKHPTETKHVPQELMQITLDVLEMIDLDTGRGSKRVAEKIAKIRSLYASYKNDPTYQIVYDEVTANMLDQLSQTIQGTRLQDMNESQLRAVYEALKSLTHVIDTAVKVKIGNEERNAFELSREMTRETRGVPKAQRGWLREKLIPAHLRADVAFRRFAGFKKNSAWETMAKLLNDGQLKETRLRMELSRPFEKIFSDQKALADFSGINTLGKLDKSKLVDIKLKNADGNTILVTHDIMVGLYMDLLNEDNRRHFINGGKTIPNLEDYYNGKSAWGAGAQRSAGIAERLSELNRQYDEAQRTYNGSWADDLKAQIDALKSEGEEYADKVQAAIEAAMTEYDRAWVEACQQLMDVDSKRELNRTTMDVYGIEKASVPNYWPITSDPDFLSKPMETVVQDMSLENVGFMKERIKGANPSLALGTVQTVTRQIDRVSHYCGMMPAVRSFGKVWNKTEAGYADSIKKATREMFQKSGVDYVENLIADLNGGRQASRDALGLSAALGKLRGNLAQTTLTLNIRVALAQAASYPTAAAELGWGPLAKALARGGKDGRIISSADTELIAKYSPLLYHRMQGYSSPELGDIQSSNRLSSRIWRKARWATGWIQAVDGATVGRLWYAAEYWVQENKPTLRKGTDAYYEAVAEKFNAVVEKTQPNYTTMQRAAILRDPDNLVKTFTMFMTQRLQNYNILYDATASYQKARADLANGINGVTEDDVKEARQNVARAVTSQLAQTAVYVGFKVLADALLHNMKKYRDKDTGDFTPESVSLAVLDAYLDAWMGINIFGSELYGVVKAATGVSKWYGLSVSGVDSVNDLIENMLGLIQADWSSEEGRKKAYTKLLKAGESLAQAMGIPLTNGIKLGQAVYYRIVDMADGHPFGFDAGYERTKKQTQTKAAVDAGVPKRLYLDTIKEANTNGGTLAQDELGTYLREALPEGKLTEDQADAIWSVQGWSTDRAGWNAKAEKKEAKAQWQDVLDAANAAGDGKGNVTQEELASYLTGEISAGRLTAAEAEEAWKVAGPTWKKSYAEYVRGK